MKHRVQKLHLIWPIWLLILTIFGSTFHVAAANIPLSAPNPSQFVQEGTPLRVIDWIDTGNARGAYDGPENSSSAYDETARLNSPDHKSFTHANRTLFGQFGESVAAEGGGDILANTYRLATPSTRAEISALNRLNFDRAAPTIVRQRSTQLFSEVSGKPINGYYNQATNQIFLGKGSNLGTLTEELIHAGQRLDFGARIPPNMIPLMEKQAERQLDRLGFELVDP